MGKEDNNDAKDKNFIMNLFIPLVSILAGMGAWKTNLLIATLFSVGIFIFMICYFVWYLTVKSTDERILRQREQRLRQRRKNTRAIQKQMDITNRLDDLRTDNCKKNEKRKNEFIRIMFIQTVACALCAFAAVTIYYQESAEVGVNIGDSAQSDVDGTLADGVIRKEEAEEPDTNRKIEDNISFILDDPSRIMLLSQDYIMDVFYLQLNEESDNAVKVHMEILQNEKKENHFSRVTEIEKGVLDSASKEQILFEQNVKIADNYRKKEDYDNWIIFVPHSSDLDSRMQKRESFWSEDEELDKCNSSIAWLNANDNQTYAKEYMAQGGKPETVIYYLGMAIIWTERALSYEDICDSDVEKYKGYLRGRYKDISDYIANNLDRITEGERENYQNMQKIASEIYNSMGI